MRGATASRGAPNVWAGEFERARDLYAQSLVIARELGDVSGMASFALNLGTVSYELRDMANTALGADGFTPVGDEPNRTTQSQLNNWIIALNNGATLIRSKPCKFSFTVPTAPPG